VFFDFFKCEDADGYNYPIVRAGDMLWMMEDLRPLAMSGLIKTSSANVWKSQDDMAAAEFVVGDRAYYTINGEGRYYCLVSALRNVMKKTDLFVAAEEVDR
jgi:hypothetical protein